MAIWRRFACWIRKATRAQTHSTSRGSTPTRTHTHSLAHTYNYVWRIAFPLQQWFRERASLLRYIACLVKRACVVIVRVFYECLRH